MNRLPMYRAVDRAETLVNSALGVAVVLSLTMFFGSMVWFSASGMRVAEALMRSNPDATGTMVAVHPTNAPAVSNGVSAIPMSSQFQDRPQLLLNPQGPSI